MNVWGAVADDMNVRRGAVATTTCGILFYLCAPVFTRVIVFKQRQMKTKYCMVHVLGVFTGGVSVKNKFRAVLVLRNSERESWRGGRNYSSRDQE